jgi:hypothetical protein
LPLAPSALVVALWAVTPGGYKRADHWAGPAILGALLAAILVAVGLRSTPRFRAMTSTKAVCLAVLIGFCAALTCVFWIEAFRGRAA